MLKSVWHTSFTVSDLEQSLVFYRDLLGLEVVHEQRISRDYVRKIVGYPDADLKMAMLNISGNPVPSGHILELIEYVAPEGKQLDLETCNVGAGHIAFEVEDLPAVYETLKAKGVKFVSDPSAIDTGRHKGGYAVYSRDPDGVTIEFIQPQAAEEI